MKIAIIQYSMYGHIDTMAKSIKEGVESTGLASKVDIFLIEETLSEEVLQLMHAPAKPDYPIASNETLTSYDAFIFGIPTRYGTMPAQFTAFFGATGGLWASGALHGKPAGFFVSTGSQGGGQESTVRNVLSLLTHHGMIYVPLGYANAFAEITNLNEIHGGSPYGAGTLAGGDGSRQPSELELKVAKVQGESFAKTAIKFVKDTTGTIENKTEAVATETKDVTNEKVEKETKNTTREKQAAPKPDVSESSNCGIKCAIM